MLTDKSKHFRDESPNQAKDIIIEAREAMKKILDKLPENHIVTDVRIVEKDDGYYVKLDAEPIEPIEPIEPKSTEDKIRELLDEELQKEKWVLQQRKACSNKGSQVFETNVRIDELNSIKEKINNVFEEEK